MKGSTKSLLWIGVSILFVFFVFQISCQKQEKEIPVTSYSDEAKQLFIEARDKYEFLRREKAEVLLREALEKATKNAYRASEGEQFLISALKAHYWEKDYAKAIKVYEQLIDIYPKDARACWLLARVYRDLGDSAKAIEQDQKAITINKDFAPAYKDLGYRYSARGDYKKAEKYFQKYLLLNPLEKRLAPYYKDYFASESLFWEAWIAVKEHKFDKALDKAAEYRTALEEMDDSKRLKYHIALLGHIAMAQGETRSAFELFKNASIDDPFFHYLTARAKDKSGDKEAAAKYFRRAANWNTDSLHYALIRQKALARKVMLASTDAQ